MDKLSRASSELREMDALAALSSPIHALHPLAKLLVTLFYIFTVVSFGKYDFSGLAAMLLYPLFAYSASGIPIRLCFRKLRVVLPLVCAVGIVNPFLDRAPLLILGSVAVSGGVVSMLTLMGKGILCLLASFLLVATTSMDSICAALRKVHVPRTFVTLLLLTYRYAALMVDEVGVMSASYRLRAPGQRGLHFSAWGSFLGQLLLRSMDRAIEIYSAMELRGFCGDFPYADCRRFAARDWLFLSAVCALFVLFRAVNIAALLGAWVM
ncbi:MAG: cobalt ECF transporter T component CbiQ [Firmicutes bacterium]|nr:cobalt ECF transporter T component CbiQ [Bacillota bacterium]